MKINILITFAGLLSFSSIAAIADTSSALNMPTEKGKPFVLGEFISKAYQSMNGVVISGNGLAEQHHLEKAIQENAEQKHAVKTKKYAHIISLAENKQSELENRKNEVTRTYNKWHDLKSAMAASHGMATANDFKAAEVAAKAYSAASKAFIELQKEVLIKAKIPHENHAEFIVVMR